MAVPRSRTSNSKKNSRRAHDSKTPKNVVSCSNCKEPTLPHRICPSCGYYDKKQTLVEKPQE